MHTNNNLEKQEFRYSVISERERFSHSENVLSSQLIFNRIEKLGEFQDVSNILLFWSMKSEVFTHDFVNKWNGRKSVYLPAIAEDGLVVKKFNGRLKRFNASKFELFEPSDGPVIHPSRIDLAIVPGLAFDQLKNRLGYGKGYYDQLLSHMDVFKIGVCFRYQLFSEIPYTSTDIRMDMVVTD